MQAAVRLTIAAAVVALAFQAPPASAQRNRNPPTPRLTAETLVPEQLFPAEDGKKFGYPDPFQVAYFAVDGEHRFKLTDVPVSELPSSTPAPDSPSGDGEAPAPTPTEPVAAPTPTPAPLEPLPDGAEFDQSVGLLRPTLVRLIFNESAEAAQAMLESFREAKQIYYDLSSAEAETETEEPAEDEAPAEDKADKPYVPPIAVFKLDPEPALGNKALVYNREFNLGKFGGMRRASAIVVVKDNVVLFVDAPKGLRDGLADGEYPSLERRARAVAQYLLKKL